MSNRNLRITIALGSVAMLLLVDFSLFRDFLFPFRVLWHQGKLAELSLSLILLLWDIFGAFLIFVSGRGLLRKVTLPLFLFFFLFNLGSFDIAKSPIDFQQTTMIVENFRWWFWEVVENYGLAALPLLILFIPVTILVERLPELLKLNVSRKCYLVPISSVFLTIIGLQYTHGFVDRYPSFFRVPSMLVFAGQSRLYDGERAPVTYSGSLGPQVEKIVLIVDESVRADILGINGYNKDTTPYLSALTAGMVNFGLAASSSNCSDYSNLILRAGARKVEIPDEDQITLKEPSIWQFTRRAGYYNVYLDAQSAEEWGNYQNFMNGHEASFVDEILRVRQKVAYESDGVARAKLIKLLEQPGKTFIIFNKYGIHFPYFRSYPKQYTIFTPALERGEPMNDRERSLNSYMNGIRWSVDEWFEKLLAQRKEFRPFVIIYTSDHGQNIVDDGTLATHCRPNGNRFEGIVPMVIFSNDAVVLNRFKAALGTGYDKTSHFQIFPTLLRLAGYKRVWVKSHYGASLSESPGSAPEFFVGDLHGRGSVRRWISIFPSNNTRDTHVKD